MPGRDPRCYIRISRIILHARIRVLFAYKNLGLFRPRRENFSRVCDGAPTRGAVGTGRLNRARPRASWRSQPAPSDRGRGRVRCWTDSVQSQVNLTRRSCAHGRRCAARGCTPQRALSGLARAPRRSRARRHRGRPWTPPTGGARVSPANLHDACATYFRRIRIRTYSFACANTRIIRV